MSMEPVPIKTPFGDSIKIEPDPPDDDDDDDVYLKKITTRVSQNSIPHRNADQPKA
jgi:hypothetical protein